MTLYFAKSTMRTAVSISAAFLSLATLASAQTILVDFSENSGVASPNWNLSNTASFNITDMVDSNGNATGIDLVFTAPGTPSESGLWGVTGAPSPFDTSAAYNDGLFGGSGVITTFELRNLSPTDTYTLTLFASRDTTTNRTTNYTVTGSGTGSTLSLQTSGANVGGAGINHNISNVAVFSDISANGSNVITVSFTNPSDFSYLNAMEIHVIPEPASFAMILGGIGLMLIFVRRKMRR